MRETSSISSPVHLLFLLTSKSIGGAEVHAISLANDLRKCEFRVSLVFLKDESDGPDFVKLADGIASFSASVKSRLDRAAIAKLSAFAEKEAVDVIVCVNPFPLLYAVATRKLCARRIRVAEILHSTEPFSLSTNIKMLAYRPIFWVADLLIYVCENQRKYWEKNRLRARTACVIHNGVDLSRFCSFSHDIKLEFRKRYGFTESDYVVGLCAYMRPEKGHVDLVKAVAAARASKTKVKCLLIGDGPSRPNIENAIAQCRLESHVAITGLVDDVRLAIASCDVMSIPSRNETFSMAALEAMASHKPVIMSDVGGASELVEPGLNGYLYPKGGTDELAYCLEMLADPAQREAFGKRAYQTVESKFSSHTMVRKYATTFLHLVNEKGVPSNAYL
jgi:glycosyltransferase involved in cell wall biosynthesis